MRKLAPIAAAAVLTVAGGSAAAAAPSDWEHFSGTESADFEFCGLTFHSEITFSDRVKFRQPRHDGEPPLIFLVYRSHETLTANGRTLTIDRQGVFKEVEATLVEGTVYQYVGSELGYPFTVRDESGTVLFDDRGILRTTFRVDTRGDADPDNDVFIEGSQSVLADKGGHPGFLLDFCEDFAPYFEG